MNLYQIVLEIYDGMTSYQEKQFVLASDDRVAARYARKFADTWRPNARHDHEHDLYSDPDGWPQWMLTQCAVVTQFTVPVAGQDHSAHVVLIPWQNSFAEMLMVIAQLLRAHGDSALADCSLQWVTQEHLDLSERAITQARQAVIELQDHVVGCAVIPTRENEIAL